MEEEHNLMECDAVITGIPSMNVGPAARRDEVPITITLLGAALASAPVWFGLGWIVTLVH